MGKDHISVFYDLETTDKNPIGQILNLCFIATDVDFNILEEFSREIRISRLQLPLAGAILANRTDVIAHQERVGACERDVLRELWLKLNEWIKSAKSVKIIGFNNLGFDQNYLRTSFIRNGLNPYYPKHVAENDLFLLTQYLSITSPNFPRKQSKKIRTDNKKMLSLSLETVSTALGLLEGSQTHHSRDDVLLSIKLAKAYKETFGVSINDFKSYKISDLHPEERVSEQRGAIVFRSEPHYDLDSSELKVNTPYLFLDANYRYSLWIDLFAFEKGQKALRMCKVNQGVFFNGGHVESTEQFEKLKKEALDKYAKVNLNNYFTPTTCDIEQFIYRIDFQGIETLNRAIWQNDSAGLALEDAKRIWGRFRLANYVEEELQSNIFKERLKQYALYRYGGKLRLDRGIDYEDQLNNVAEKPRFHPTFNQLVAEIDTLLQVVSEEDAKLMRSLKDFYYSSEIYQIAGKELEELPANNS